MIVFVTFGVLALITAICVVRIKPLWKTLTSDLPQSTYRYEIILHLTDTLLFPVFLLSFLMVFVPFYRYKYVRFEFLTWASDSQEYRGFLVMFIYQIYLEIVDLCYAILLVFCSIFIWRFIPFINSSKLSENWHENTKELYFECIADIPCIILTVLIFGTVYRVPMFFRRKRLHDNGSYLKLLLGVSSEIFKDMFVLPYVLVKLVTPWRLIPAMIQVWKTNNPKEQRKILKQDGLRPLEDYITILLTIILLLSI